MAQAGTLRVGSEIGIFGCKIADLGIIVTCTCVIDGELSPGRKVVDAVTLFVRIQLMDG